MGYIGRADVNNGIVYCSESKIVIGEMYSSSLNDAEPVYQKKNADIASADTVFSNVIDKLVKDNVVLTKEELKNSLIVYSLDDVVTIVVKGNTDETVQEICSIYTAYAAKQLASYYDSESVTVLNDASAPFTAVISTTADTKAPTETITVVTPAAKTEITTSYIILEMVKYGILGGILGLLVVIFVFSVKLLLKGRD